ncbi:MAG: AAA family ATPase [Prevotella sp.]|jgi:predicted AAA+ superfamily ATPase|nr:AAA family ATPase [Prevotella sp.]
MKRFYSKFHAVLHAVDYQFVRSISDGIDWNGRLVGLTGTRGIGKTTLLLQYIRGNLPIDESVLYISMNSFCYTGFRLHDLVESFVKNGGEFLFIDDIHKYSGWVREILRIYDDFPHLHIVFVAFSLPELGIYQVPFSRKAMVYGLQGLSFREYLNKTAKTGFPAYRLEDIMRNHDALSHEITAKIAVMPYFQQYLQQGYYPYPEPEQPPGHIEELLNTTIETEFPLSFGVEPDYLLKMKRLFYILAGSAPCKPNVSELSRQLNITRVGLLNYLNVLNRADATIHLYRSMSGTKPFGKPDLIYLENPNLLYAFCADTGNLQKTAETFFVNQVRYMHEITLDGEGRFRIDNVFPFDVCNAAKKSASEKVFRAVDGIEHGNSDRDIPLWLFGFLY